MKPLAIDLFCGLSEPQLLGAAYAAVEQFVARWAKDPHHVTLRVGRQPPSAVALELRFVRDLQNALLSARFARLRHLWIAPRQTIERRVFARTLRLVLGAPLRVFAPRPDLAKAPRRRRCAICRAVPSIAARRHDFKVGAAPQAFAAALSRSLVLLASHAPRATCAVAGAPLPVGSYGAKRCGALPARQIVHRLTVA